MSIPACLHCRCEESTVLLTKVAGGEELALRSCRRCGLVFLDGWRPEDEPEFYDGVYDPRATLDPDDLYLPLTTARLTAVLDDLGRRVDGRRLLDVACGAGQLLYAARAAGWDARGIELSDSAVSLCRRFGLEADVIDVFSTELPEESFDVVTMIEFIEHVADPGAYLRRAEELLAPGGVVYLTTPNFASLGRRVLRDRWRVIGAGHQCYFTPRTFKRVAADSTSLRIRRITTKNLSAAAIKALFRRSGGSLGDGPGDDSFHAIGAIDPAFAQEQRLRHRVEGSTVLRLAKPVVNAALNATRLGEQMVVHLEKRGK